MEMRLYILTPDAAQARTAAAWRQDPVTWSTNPKRAIIYIQGVIRIKGAERNSFNKNT
jgi:hypothetical protein